MRKGIQADGQFRGNHRRIFTRRTGASNGVASKFTGIVGFAGERPVV